jgi:hypothetical protein
MRDRKCKRLLYSEGKTESSKKLAAFCLKEKALKIKRKFK